MNGEDLVADFSGAWIALHWIPVEATFHVLSSPLFHYKDQIIFNSFLSSLRKNGKQYGSFLRDLDSNPSSASRSLPQAWLLHCRVLDMLGVDYLRLHPRDNLCTLRDRVPEP